MLWTTTAPVAKEIADAHFALEHREFVSGAVAKTSLTRLLPGENPMVVMSPLGLVLKWETNKFRLTVNIRYVNRHMEKKVFKFEGLKYLADLA